MIDESKIIFFTGAPGSKWSAFAHLLSFSSKFSINTSDRSLDREYQHTTSKVKHQGTYWGPGNQFGGNFHNINNMSKKDILDEIEKPYADKNWDQYRIIKCHQFSINLDYIKTTFPTSKIVIVLRPDAQCELGWLSSGGFDLITYPDYHTYYKNPNILKEQIIIENQMSKEWIVNNKLDLNVVDEKYWLDKWGVARNSPEIDTYMSSMEKRFSRKDNKYYWNFDIIAADYNF